MSPDYEVKVVIGVDFTEVFNVNQAPQSVTKYNEFSGEPYKVFTKNKVITNKSGYVKTLEEIEELLEKNNLSLIKTCSDDDEDYTVIGKEVESLRPSEMIELNDYTLIKSEVAKSLKELGYEGNVEVFILHCVF